MSSAADSHITPVPLISKLLLLFRPQTRWERLGQYFGLIFHCKCSLSKVFAISTTDHQELSSSWNRRTVSVNDDVVGHRLSSIRDICICAVSQCCSSSSAATIPAVVFDDLGAMHV